MPGDIGTLLRFVTHKFESTYYYTWTINNTLTLIAESRLVKSVHHCRHLPTPCFPIKSYLLHLALVIRGAMMSAYSCTLA